MFTTHCTSAALAPVPARIAGKATLRIDPSMNASDEAATDMTSVQPGRPRIISSPAFEGEGDQRSWWRGSSSAKQNPSTALRAVPLPEKSQGGSSIDVLRDRGFDHFAPQIP